MKYEQQPTPKTPYFCIDFDKGEMILQGRLIPENSIEWFNELKPYIETYLQSPQSFTQLIVRLEYINTSSRGHWLLFELLEKHFKDNPEAFLCKWFYESDDADMLEVGADLKSIIKLHFKFVEIYT